MVSIDAPFNSPARVDLLRRQNDVSTDPGAARGRGRHNAVSTDPVSQLGRGVTMMSLPT